ncbi:MAG TPA: secretin N-terminal domain-containing protein [Polyangia bacterium]|nr:secretin N-terminal domain-containing protein [Polyangia bacterium]
MSQVLPRIMAWGAVLALLCAGLPMGVSAAGSPAPVTVQKVTVVQEAGAIEIGIEASGTISSHTSELSDPVRYMIDVPDAANGVAWSTQDVGVGALRSVRVGQLTDSPVVTRIVLDLAQPTKWSVRRAAPGVLVARLEVPEAQGSRVSPWGAMAGAGPAGSAQIGAADSASAGPEHPAGRTAADPARAPRKGALSNNVSAGPPAGVPGMVVAQAAPSAQRTLTLDLRDAQLGDILDALARLCGLNVVTDSSTSGARVTIHLVGVTCDEALHFVLDANNLGYRRVGQTLVILPVARLTPPPAGPVVRVYHLEYVQPPIETPEPLVGTNSGTTATVTGGAGTVKKDTASLLALFTTSGAQIVYDDRTNSLVVTGTPAQQDAVVALLRQIDVPIPQVIVQALVVDITTSAIKNLGVTWSIFNGVTFNEVPGPQTPPGMIGIGPIARDILTARLQASITNNAAKVLSDPRISTFDGQEALIFAGDQIPIVNTTTSGNPPVTSETVTFQPIGVTLKIVPKINSDRTINMLVHPLVTTATSFTAATVNNPNGLPIIATREAATSARVADGDSVVVGGLMRYSDIKNIQKIPLLGDLPFLGGLFRIATSNHQEAEVVIVLTPRIVSTGQAVPPPQPVQP